MEHRPPDAPYYFLVGVTRQGLRMRAPARGSYRLDPFEHPAANPGLYHVRYCRDRAGQHEVATRAIKPLLRLMARDTAQEQAAQAFAAFKSTVLLHAPQEAAAYSLVSCDGVAQQVPDAGRRWTLREPFQFPQEVLVGTWEVHYHATATPDAACLDVAPRVLIDVVEPVGYGDLETLLLSMDGRAAWFAKQRAAEQAQLDLLHSAVAELQTLRGSVADLRKQIAPRPIDYSPVLLQVIATLRDLWMRPATAQAGAATQSACSEQGKPSPSRKRRRRRRSRPAQTDGTRGSDLAETEFEALHAALKRETDGPFAEATSGRR